MIKTRYKVIESFKGIFTLLLLFIFLNLCLFLETMHSIKVWIGKYIINQDVYAASNSV